MRKLLLSLTVVGFFALAFVPSARADTVTYDLNYLNASGYPSPYGSVTVDLTSTTTATITFTADSNSTYTYYFVDSTAADVNVNTTYASTWTIGTFSTTDAAGNTINGTGTNGTTGSPLSDTSSNTVDGWGTFNQTTSLGSASTNYTTVSFVITNTSGTWSSASQVLAENSKGYSVAAHISLYYADGSPVTYTDSSGKTQNLTLKAAGTSPVPEPASLLLLGSGLLGLGAIRLRRKGEHKE